MKFLPVIFFGFFLIYACNSGSKNGANEIESIPGVSCYMQITSGLDENNQPINNVDYFPPQLGKAYAFVNFEQIPNDTYHYQCKISKGDEKDLFIAHDFNFEVNSGNHQVWSWVGFENLSGPGEYTMDIYLNEKMIMKASFSILTPTQMNSNYPAYWLGENLFGLYQSNNNEKHEEWKVSTLTHMEDPIVSVNVMPYKNNNRFFVTTASSQGSRKLFEVKRNEKNLIRDFGFGPIDEVEFRTTYFDDHIVLLNPAGTFNMRVSLISGEWKPVGKEEAYNWPESMKFRTRTGSGEQLVKMDCKDGVRYVDGGSFWTLADLHCEKSVGWATWHKNDQRFYFSEGSGVYAYDTYERQFSQILYDPSIHYLDYFQNNEMDFLAYSKGEILKVATNFKTKAWFENEIDYENKFRRLLSEWSVYEPSKEISYHSEPITIIDHEVSYEIEGERMVVEEMGVFTDGSYREAKLWRIYKDYYYEKGPEPLYENVEIGYMIKLPSVVIVPANHMPKKWLNNLNFTIPDPGFAFNRSKEFSDETQFFIDSNAQFEKLTIQDTLSLDSTKLVRIATITEYTQSEFEPLDDTFLKQKNDDGSINLIQGGVRVVYQYGFFDAIVDPENIQLSEYEIFTTRSCDGSRSDIASIHDIEVSELSTIGSINGQPIYSFKNQNHTMLKSEYESYKTALEDSGVLEYDESIEIMSYDQFLSKPAIFFWRDPFGRFVRFIHRDILPPMNCEPIVYFYPETTEEVEMTLDKKINVLTSYPNYNDGWSLMVQPDGQFIDAKSGSSDHRVFWEGISNILPRLKRGHVVKREEIDDFLSKRLLELGLNPFEISEFKTAWLSDLTTDNYCFIGFYDQEVINKYAPMQLDPTPESLIRILMDYEALSAYRDVPAPEILPTPERRGFTVVEWGGLKR